eukprot:242356_1
MGSEQSLPLDPYNNPWIIDWLTSPAFIYMTWVLNCIQIVTMPCLGITYIYQLLQPDLQMWLSYQNTPKTKPYINNSIHIITLICIFFSFISGIIAFLNNMALISHDSSCVSITIVLNICWLITKISIYNVTLLRLQLIFWGTPFKYNDKFMYVMYTVINLVFIIAFIGTFIHTDSILFEHDNGVLCFYIIPSYLIFLPAALDLFATPIAVYLIVKPLKMARRDPTINRVLKKYVLLSTIAILSNVFSSVFFGITDIAFFNDTIDVIINPVCLVLMHWNINNPFTCRKKNIHLNETDEKNANTTATIHIKNVTLPTNDSANDIKRNSELTHKYGQTITEMQSLYTKGITEEDTKTFQYTTGSERTTTSDLIQYQTKNREFMRLVRKKENAIHKLSS